VSHENVEIVQRVWRLFAAGLEQGKGAVDAGTVLFDEGLFAPECTFTPVPETPGSKTYVGREGFAAFLREWTEDWDQWTARLEGIVDATGDRVVATLHQSARGKSSGVAVENRFWAVYTLRGGQVVDQVHYLERAEALQVAGLVA
jgi:ketosteroid isomerase-like protein